MIHENDKVSSEEPREKQVFTINESQLKGQAQCQEHRFIKLSNNEVECTKCPTVLRYDPKKMKLTNKKLCQIT